MKNKLLLVNLLVAAVALVSCSTPNPDDGKPKLVDSYLLHNTGVEYKLGDTFEADVPANYTYVQEYSDGRKVTQSINKITEVKGITNPSLGYSETDLVFKTTGLNRVAVTFNIKRNAYSSSIKVDIPSPKDDNYTINDVTLVNPLGYTANYTFAEVNPNIAIEITWKKGNDTLIEYTNDKSGKINQSLTSSGSSINIQKTKLSNGKSYHFEAFYTDAPNLKIEESFTLAANKGYYKMDKSSLIHEDFENVAPHEGKTILLVIPLNIQPGDENYTGIEWTQEREKSVYDFFLGKREDTPGEWNSLKTYYETTSHNAINIDAVITPVYQANPSNFTMKSILESSYSYATLHRLFAESIAYFQETLTLKNGLKWTDLDKNDDGYIDNLHFITNVDYNTSTKGGDNRALWPHKFNFQIHQTPDLNYPVGNVYESTALGHFNEQTTIIHEQGHVFGIDDYYDYSYSGVDYVGCYDMQSHNCFDWNSFSKFSVGWARPYVVDGSEKSTTIAINPASLEEDFIVIPANHDTYNGSAFDEYFLVEFFTNDGNNAYHWQQKLGTSVTQGIKIYHVDARLCNYRSQVPSSIQEVKDAPLGTYGIGVNNDYQTTRSVHKDWKDFKLLALIQSGGINTFGEVDGNGKYDYLSTRDLFHPGDKFTFDKYKHFLTKTDREVTATDEGEEFPYEITIQNFVGKKAFITITKQ